VTQTTPPKVFFFVFSATEIPSRRHSQIVLTNPTTHTGKPTDYFHFPKKKKKKKKKKKPTKKKKKKKKKKKFIF